MDQQALFLTLRLATVTTVILTAIAIPLSYWLAYAKSRAKPWIEAVVALPLVLPPTVLGFYLLVLLGPRTAIGRALAGLFGHPLAFSFAGLVVGSVLYSLPFAVQPLAAGFASVDPEIREAALLALAPLEHRPLPCAAPGDQAVPAYGGRSILHPHRRRVRRGADDWRRHSRPYADTLDLDLRPGAELLLRSSQ